MTRVPPPMQTACDWRRSGSRLVVSRRRAQGVHAGSLDPLQGKPHDAPCGFCLAPPPYTPGCQNLAHGRQNLTWHAWPSIQHTVHHDHDCDGAGLSLTAVGLSLRPSCAAPLSTIHPTIPVVPWTVRLEVDKRHAGLKHKASFPQPASQPASRGQPQTRHLTIMHLSQLGGSWLASTQRTACKYMHGSGMVSLSLRSLNPTFVGYFVVPPCHIGRTIEGHWRNQLRFASPAVAREPGRPRLAGVGRLLSARE